MRISVIGLGKLGTPVAACYAARGHHVIGVDRNEQVVAALREGRCPVCEPGLDALLRQTGDRLSATNDGTHAVLDTEITFVLVPTPSDARGAFSLRHILAAVEVIGEALRIKEAYHVVVVASTVMPGDTGGKIRQALERHSGKRCGADFGLCYSPEFVAIGSVIHDLQHPDFILIGESDPRAGDLAAAAVQSLCANARPIHRMAFVNAELAKIAVNTFVTTKISFANMIGELCERLDGGDVDTVTRALGADRRIGPDYLKAGLGYGGPCFPRDNRALAAVARRARVAAPIPYATDRANRRQIDRLETLVHAAMGEQRATVGILGLSYKPHTPVTEETQGLELAQRLAAAGTQVVAYDPLISDTSLMPPGAPIRLVGSVHECADNADVLVVCNPCREFLALNEYQPDPRDFRARTLIDCWRILDGDRLGKEMTYIALGRFRAGTCRRRPSKSRTSVQALAK